MAQRSGVVRSALYKAPETGDSERFLSELENACGVSQAAQRRAPLS